VSESARTKARTEQAGLRDARELHRGNPKLGQRLERMMTDPENPEIGDWVKWEDLSRLLGDKETP
jgi:hypothetical protein